MEHNRGKRCNPKAQVSVEFIVIFAGMLAVFLVVISITSQRSAEFDSQKEYLDARYIGMTVARSVEEAHLAGPGSSVTLYLPGVLSDNKDYNVTLYPDSRVLEVEWERGVFQEALQVRPNQTRITFSPGARLLVSHNLTGVHVSLA